VSAVRVEVDRLQVSLHAVSATLAEDFSTRLRSAIEQRLSGLPANSVTTALDLPLLDLGRIELRDTPDAGVLAGIVADRLVQLLAVRCGSDKKENGGGNA
jgi:hypothetical protein